MCFPLVITLAMYIPSHSNLKNENIPQELIDGDYDIPNGKFVSFTNQFKIQVPRHLSLTKLSDDTDIDLRMNHNRYNKMSTP
mmetsp:Transcript_20989/g.24313  ORF Transcript_20989/g.24313 Transcript_20989/m.24313 type:complete len:82 (-) Transcript_20989:537-782(-)